MAERPRVIVLGAGPAGVGAAYRLRESGRADVVLLEARDDVGGNAGSFELHGQPVDYGSHRLHPACDLEILADIERLLGDELVRRPRHGRIRLRGRWIHFPLKPVDLLLRLDRRFALGALRDAMLRPLPRPDDADETFAAILRGALGATICDEFYFPYARKIWGVEPHELSAIQARRRVAANSVGKLIRKVLGQLPGVRPVGFSHFYYPRGGYGRISSAYADAARTAGAEIRLRNRVVGLCRDGSRWRVLTEAPEGTREVIGDLVWSTIPITLLARLSEPPPPDQVLAAAEGIRFRQMLLVYLTLDRDRYTEFDAHYFPGPEVGMTRLSEPKNYSQSGVPAGRTTLCAELPCSLDDDVWSMSEEELGRRIVADLRAAELPSPGPIVGVHVERLRFAYPIYEVGYDEHFRVLDRWARETGRLLTLGRQGLFAHDNTHHALAMAYAAVDCLGPEGFDDARWSEYRVEFESHVVED